MFNITLLFPSLFPCSFAQSCVGLDCAENDKWFREKTRRFDSKQMKLLDESASFVDQRPAWIYKRCLYPSNKP